jgi:hypothetical protein
MIGSYCFFPAFSYQRLRWNGGVFRGGRKKFVAGAGYFNLCMNKAIEDEITVCQDLELQFKRLNIIRLPYSGIHSGGNDIILTAQDITESQICNKVHYKMNVKRWVRNSLIAIEVIGVYQRSSGKYRFTYPADKDFLQWAEGLLDMGVIPVLSWVLHDKVYYMPLWAFTEDAIKHVFWTSHNKKKYGYRQRQSYSPVERTVDLSMDLEGFYKEMRHLGRAGV